MQGINLEKLSNAKVQISNFVQIISLIILPLTYLQKDSWTKLDMGCEWILNNIDMQKLPHMWSLYNICNDLFTIVT